MNRSAAVKFAFTFLSVALPLGSLSLGLLSSATAGTVFIVDGPYRGIEDSPFDLSGLGTTFFLEDFEDGELNTPGVVFPRPATSRSYVLSPSVGAKSVEIGGYSLRPFFSWNWSSSPSFPPPNTLQTSFVFDAAVLGFLPTEFGFVWTGGAPNSTLTLDLFDSNMNLIDTLRTTGLGEEDTFIGVTSSEGIRSVRFYSEGPYQIDHLQYGISVPEPRSILLALIGFLPFILLLFRNSSLGSI